MIKAKNIIKIVLILLLAANSSLAQPITSHEISLSWEIVKDNYPKSGEMLSELSITNSSESSFPGSGWEIYFNAPLLKLSDEKAANFKITHINGSFYKLSPNKSFKGILSGETESIKLFSRVLRNITDYPNGFYIVHENAPLKPVLLKTETKSAINNSILDKKIANQTYQKNKLISLSKTNELAPILPSPKNYKYLTGNFELTGKVRIVTLPVFENEANYLAEEMKGVLGVKLEIVAGGEKDIILIQQDKSIVDEGYELKITPSKIVITASKSSGVFYGIQTLKNLLPVDVWKKKTSNIPLKALEIKDEPRFRHRAFMMDIARNFLPKEQILKTLDVLSLYKMNTLHLHFNDDEGWRIEIKGLPELTEVGSKRGHTFTELDRLIPAYGSGPFVDNKSGTGYLTREDFIEILKYATERHIAVIPEYETPGHARAAIKAMDSRYHRYIKEANPEEAKKYMLRDLNDQSEYESVQGFTDNVINPAVPSVYNFIEKLTDETIAMYEEAGAPLKTIHYGGDEVPAGVWEKSPMVMDLLKRDPSIKSIDELWQYYYSKVNQILKTRNLYLSGWEEIGLKKSTVNGISKMVLDNRFADRNYHTDVWNNLEGNEDLAYKLANAGYKVVLTNVTNMYLDLAYNKSYQEPGQYWGGYVDVDKPFKFIPLNYYKNQKEDKLGNPLAKDFYNTKDTLTKFGETNIVGLQAPLWSEVITSKERFEYLLLPKLLGVAERSWAQNPAWAIEADSTKSELLYGNAWSSFISLISKNEFGKLDHYSGGFNYRIPSVGYTVENNKIKANVLYPDLTIRYTEDGTEPNVNSKIYSSEIPYDANIRMKVYNKEGRGSSTVLIQN